MKTIVNLTAYILILLGLYSCNDDVFVDDFRTSDTEFTLDGNGDEVTIRFASSNWDLVWMYTYDSDFTHQYEVYDADDNLIMRNQDVYLKGLGKIVCNEKLTDFIIQRRVGIVRTFNAEDKASGAIAPKRLYIKPHVSYDLLVYGATRKRGFVKEGIPTLVPGSFGIVGLNFAPMYNFNNYFRAGLSVDAQFDESANIKDYKLVGTYGDDIKFHRPPFREQFAVGLSLRAELVMPIFSINVGIGRNMIYSGDDTEGFYQILALKTYVTRHLFLHVGYQLSKFKDPNNLMLGIGYRFHDKR